MREILIPNILYKNYTSSNSIEIVGNIDVFSCVNTFFKIDIENNINNKDIINYNIKSFDTHIEVIFFMSPLNLEFYEIIFLKLRDTDNELDMQNKAFIKILIISYILHDHATTYLQLKNRLFHYLLNRKYVKLNCHQYLIKEKCNVTDDNYVKNLFKEFKKTNKYNYQYISQIFNYILQYMNEININNHEILPEKDDLYNNIVEEIKKKMSENNCLCYTYIYTYILYVIFSVHNNEVKTDNLKIDENVSLLNLEISLLKKKIDL